MTVAFFFFPHHFSTNRFIESTFKVTHLLLLHDLRRITCFYLLTKPDKVEPKQQSQNFSLASPFRKLPEQHFFLKKGHTLLMSFSAHSAFWCKELTGLVNIDDGTYDSSKMMSGKLELKVSVLIVYHHLSKQLERRWCQLIRVKHKLNKKSTLKQQISSSPTQKEQNERQ